MTAAPPPLADALRDRYVLDRELGRGGMATVYLAGDLKHQRAVALKLLHPYLAESLGPDRFLREIRLTARLQHPHVLPVFDSGEDAGVLWYAMPYVAGHSLSTRLARSDRLSLADAIRILRDVADALAYAHAQGVVHRDVKPGNVLLSDDHALVTDFGIAKVISEAAGPDATQAGFAIGTPAYMAPEQSAAEPNVDHRADIYGFGAMAYELLAGEPPFAGLSFGQIAVAHATRDPVPLAGRNPDTPPVLAQLVMRCLHKDPADRWQSALEIRARLEQLLSQAYPATVVLGSGSQPGGAGAAPRTPSFAESRTAGRQAFARHDWSAAFQQLMNADTAGELEPEDLVGLGEAAWWMGRANHCVKSRERAYASYVRRGDARGAAAMALALAEDHYHWLATSVGHGWMRRAERHLATLPESPEHGWLTRTRAMFAFEVDRDLERALALADETAAIGARLGSRELQALALQDRGRILIAQGDAVEGMALMDEAMAEAAGGELGPRTAGRIYCNMMTACARLADYRRAAEWNNAASQWCEPHGQSGYPGICRIHRAELLRLRGELPSAEGEARRAAEELEHLMPDAAAEAYYELAEIRLRLGDFEGADAMFREAHQRGRDPIPGLALLRLAQGQPDAARSLIDRALDDHGLARLDRMRLLPARVEIALACNEVDVARTATAELEALANEYRSPAVGAAAAFARGALELAEQRPGDAAASLRRARKLWAETEIPYEAARARMLLARAYEALGNQEEAGLELRAATVTFERLGAQADLRRAAELRRS